MVHGGLIVKHPPWERGLPAIGNALNTSAWNIATGAGFKPAPTAGLIMRGSRPWRGAHFPISNIPFGASPYSSGAYIASTRVGGRLKAPSLFRRRVYSVRWRPRGSQS